MLATPSNYVQSLEVPPNAEFGKIRWKDSLERRSGVSESLQVLYQVT